MHVIPWDISKEQVLTEFKNNNNNNNKIYQNKKVMASLQATWQQFVDET